MGGPWFPYPAPAWPSLPHHSAWEDCFLLSELLFIAPPGSWLAACPVYEGRILRLHMVVHGKTQKCGESRGHCCRKCHASGSRSCWPSLPVRVLWVSSQWGLGTLPLPAPRRLSPGPSGHVRPLLMPAARWTHLGTFSCCLCRTLLPWDFTGLGVAQVVEFLKLPRRF